MDVVQKRCRNEVDQLHMFFTDWLSGAATPTEKSFERVANVLAEAFRSVSPRGVERSRQEMLTRLRGAHGQLPHAAIRIENFSLCHRFGAQYVVTYQEWHDGVPSSGRLSTAILTQKPGTPNGLQWLHVHETWLPGAAPESD